MNKSRNWVIIFIGLVFICLGILTSINYIIDPLWTFSHSNKYNSKQSDFNERQQKTNLVYFQGFEKYDGILLGSSRSTFINQNHFTDMNIFNFALNSIYPYEYEKYIDFVKRIKKKNLKYIIIGADFYNTAIPKNIKFEKPEFYIRNTTKPFYRYKMLLSKDTLKYSKRNYKNTKIDNKIYYDRNNIKYQKKVSENERRLRYKISLNHHLEELDSRNYIYNENYKTILEKIKDKNKNTKFIIFTSPISSNLLASIIQKSKRLKEYKRWLKELVNVFGEVNHFMTINEITTDLNNYPDDDHYYPYIGKILANKITNKDLKTPENFGIILNKNNIDNYLKTFEEKILKYKINEKL